MKKIITAILLTWVSAFGIDTIGIGDLTLEVSSNKTAVLQLQLQQRSSLNSGGWENVGHPVRWETPVSEGKFFRVQARGEKKMAYTLTYTSIDATTTSLTGYTGTPVDVVVPEIADGGRTVVSIGNACFSGVSSIQSIEMPDSITTIGISSFDGCTSLVSVKLSESLTNMGIGCFSFCVALEYIIIPSSVTNIDDGCFSICTALSSIYMKGNAPTLGTSPFEFAPATVYYLDTATGYTNPWGELEAISYSASDLFGFGNFSGVISIDQDNPLITSSTNANPESLQGTISWVR